MAGWVRRWLVHITWQSNAASPTGHYQQTVAVHSPVELHQVRQEALNNPWVATYRTVALRDWDGTGDPTHCPGGDQIVPAGITDQECLCGGHRIYRCYLDGWVQVCPPVGPECRSLATRARRG